VIRSQDEHANPQNPAIPRYRLVASRMKVYAGDWKAPRGFTSREAQRHTSAAVYTMISSTFLFPRSALCSITGIRARMKSMA
jgi:hypothetical protein